MPEGFLDGSLGAEDAPEAGRPAAGERQAESLALSMALEAARGDPEVARHSAAFMAAQAKIASMEAAQCAAELRLRLHHLRGQSLEGRLRRHGQRLKLAMQVFTAMLATAMTAGLCLLLYDASTSRSVVVEAFKAPAALAGRGLTGDVVASAVLDTLQRLQNATRGTEKGLESHGAWASNIKVDLPDTGISIGEINALLHQHLGHDVHIGGELVQTAQGGLALTVRGDGVPAGTFSGGAGDLDALTIKAAEYVYGRSQPYQYATYLEDTNRNEEARDFLAGAFVRADTDLQRARLANLWGNAYGGLFQPVPAAAKYRLAMALSERDTPQWWRAWDNLIGAVATSGGEEDGWRESEALLKEAALARGQNQPERKALTNPALYSWDLPLLLESYRDAAAPNGGAGVLSTLAGPAISDAYALLHDPARAARALASSDPDDPSTRAESLLIEAYDRLDHGDAAGAVAPLERFYKAWLADPNLQYTYSDQPCFLGLAYGLSGRMAEADAVFARIGPWSRCWAFHGEVLARAGDDAGAAHVWNDGLKILPDLPMIYLARGQDRLAHGELDEAEADLATAHAKAPHYADPLKAWGDALARQGRWAEARSRYDEALGYAPAWSALRDARNAAGRH